MATRDDQRLMIAIMLAIAILAAVAITLCVPRPALAHDHDRPDLNGWMMKLMSKRSHCCSGSDADAVEWRTTEIDQCKITGEYNMTDGAPEENKTGHYCVYMDRQWWLVPDIAVLDGEPNLDGRALVWGYPTKTDDVLLDFYIRCFLPGAGT